MASRTSITDLRGTLGNITFYKRNNKNFVRAKSSLTKEMFHANPNMLVPKKYNQEFAEAATSGKIFRHAIASILANAKDTYMVTRFTTALRKVMNTDTSELGKRSVQNGNIALLKGFNFNIHCPLKSIFFAPYQISINRPKGIIKCIIPTFETSTMLSAPPGASHFQIKTTSLEIDFISRITKTEEVQSLFLPYNESVVSINHLHPFTPQSSLPVFLIISIEFYQEIKEKMNVLKNKDFNPRTIIAADKL